MAVIAVTILEKFQYFFGSLFLGSLFFGNLVISGKGGGRY
jgi:hypothetical protein